MVSAFSPFFKFFVFFRIVSYSALYLSNGSVRTDRQTQIGSGGNYESLSTYSYIYTRQQGWVAGAGCFGLLGAGAAWRKSQEQEPEQLKISRLLSPSGR